ncbi:MAG: GNAT family N-acetyltransferase [Rhizomicrobium sp.]
MKIFEDVKFLDLPPHLEALFASAGQKSFFNLAVWYDVVSRHGRMDGSIVRLFTDDACRTGLVACQERNKPRAVAGCTTPYTCESAFLTSSPHGEPEAVRAFAREIGRSAPIETLLLTGLDPLSAQTTAAVAGLKDAGLTVGRFKGWTNWFEAVEGDDFETYLQRRPSVLKNTWERKLKALRKDFRAEFCLNDAPDRFIAEYESVYKASWKDPEPFPTFMPALIRGASSLGALRCGVLRCDGKSIAAQFWLLWRGRATIFKLAYDENWKRYSPGTLLTMEMARSVLTDDAPDEIDFGRGNDAYKRLWLSQRRDRCGIEAANPRTLRGGARAARLLARSARDFLHQRMPRSRKH